MQQRRREEAKRLLGGQCDVDRALPALDLIAAALRDLDGQYRRSVIGLFTVFAVFLLTALSSEGDLLGIKVEDLRPIRAFLPVVISVIAWQMWYLLYAGAHYEAVFDVLAFVSYPTLHRRSWHWAMIPPPGGIFGGSVGVDIGPTSTAARRLFNAVAGITALAPFLILTGCYVYLFTTATAIAMCYSYG